LTFKESAVKKSLTFFLSCLALCAQAHVTLQEPQAVAGQGYKAVLRVGHGCEGSATHTISV
jgi:periplasmic copper chaperone A